MFGATVNIWWTVGNGVYFYCANANKIGAGRPVERHSRIVPPSDKPSNCAPRYVPAKPDSLVRIIAVGQILWVSIQILIRATRHLAVSQLEIAVVAFASCAVTMYGLNWRDVSGQSTSAVNLRPQSTSAIDPHRASVQGF